MDGKQANGTPIPLGDKRRVFGNQCLGGLGVTCERSQAKSRGKSAPTKTMDAHRQGASCKIRGGGWVVFLKQSRKEREESLSSPLFIDVPTHPCSFIPRVSLGRRAVRRHKEGKPQAPERLCVSSSVARHTGPRISSPTLDRKSVV